MTKHHLDEDAMAVGGIIFGIFCLFVIIGGIIMVAANNANQPAMTDTYGNTLQAADPNGTSNSTSAMTTTGAQSAVPVLLVGSVVTIAAIVFLFYAAAKLKQ